MAKDKFTASQVAQMLQDDSDKDFDPGSSEDSSEPDNYSDGDTEVSEDEVYVSVRGRCSGRRRARGARGSRATRGRRGISSRERMTTQDQTISRPLLGRRPRMRGPGIRRGLRTRGGATRACVQLPDSDTELPIGSDGGKFNFSKKTVYIFF